MQVCPHMVGTGLGQWWQANRDDATLPTWAILGRLSGNAIAVSAYIQIQIIQICRSQIWSDLLIWLLTVTKSVKTYGIEIYKGVPSN